MYHTVFDRCTVKRFSFFFFVLMSCVHPFFIVSQSLLSFCLIIICAGLFAFNCCAKLKLNFGLCRAQARFFNFFFNFNFKSILSLVYFNLPQSLILFYVFFVSTRAYFLSFFMTYFFMSLPS